MPAPKKNTTLGFTMIELIVVTIIIAILAAIATPAYIKSMERTRGGIARAALVSIAKAEKMYSAENNGRYLAQTDAQLAAGPLDNFIEMNDIGFPADGDWQYSITTGVNTFTAIATKEAGVPNAGETITLTDAGVWGGTFTP